MVLDVNSGAKKGSALAPTPFNMDGIKGWDNIQSQCRVTLGNVKVTGLDFADDVPILSESLLGP